MVLLQFCSSQKVLGLEFFHLLFDTFFVLKQEYNLKYVIERHPIFHLFNRETIKQTDIQCQQYQLYYLLFSLLCLCRLKTMLYEYKLREKIHNLKKRSETSFESAVTPEYTYMYLGSKRSSSQGRSITSDLLHQAAVVMCLIAFIIIQIMNITVSQQSRESQSEEKQGSV